jgi:hypothetical protein
MAAIPASVNAADRDAAEADLAGYARSFNPTSLQTIGRHILAHLDPNGPEPGGTVVASEARQWACDAKNIPVVLAGNPSPSTSDGP